MPGKSAAVRLLSCDGGAANSHSGAKMTNELQRYSADVLLEMIHDQDERREDFNYEARCNLIKRWQRGVELGPLIKLLQSGASRDRVLGCWYVRELGGPIEGLKVPVIALADDWLHDGRWTFVHFMINSGFYDDTISTKLAKLLVDYHLVVRQEVIKWAMYTTDERFEHCSRFVESGASATKYEFCDPARMEFWAASEHKRAMRGLEIVRRLRDGEAVEDMGTDIIGEDSFVFDSLQSSRRIIQCHLERRRAEAQGKTT